jgi:hypothetical protein
VNFSSASIEELGGWREDRQWKAARRQGCRRSREWPWAVVGAEGGRVHGGRRRGQRGRSPQSPRRREAGGGRGGRVLPLSRDP